ncbi:Uu.00g101890.m01.CDS01 [Anthostomella pinea]|uniref:Uu.00g101890.m01.CDS01 n=1 Tax=Anthostomella pinea TaxID=933095 RepID=A0AAI8VD44_9PEZI|nr:Uu.00g101890.m01.CDS01 [Anthostomella pinea]
MSFEFVDNSVINRDARKVIRSHVMKGKNTGKTRVPRHRSARLNSRVVTTVSRQRGQAGLCDTRHLDSVVTISRQITSELCFLPFPAASHPQSKTRIHQFFSLVSEALYPPAFCVSGNVPEALWVQYLFIDEAFFHCTIAISSACVDHLVLAKPGDSTMALYHLSRALRLINQKLSGSEALSDAAIAVVIVMSMYERIRGRYHAARMHFEGMARMIQLRGGITQIATSFDTLAQKALRCDLEVALHFGGPTRFGVQDVTYISGFHDLRNQVPVVQLQRLVELSLFRSVGNELKGAVLDILSLSWLLNDRAGLVSKLKGNAFQTTLIQMGYRLVAVSPLSETCLSNQLDRVVHLALAAFIVAFWLEYGGKLGSFPLLRSLLGTSLQTLPGDDPETQTILLWACFIGRASVLKDADDTWLVPVSAKAAQAMHIRSWLDVSRVLHDFPWVSVLHDERGEALWDLVLPGLCSSRSDEPSDPVQGEPM